MSNLVLQRYKNVITYFASSHGPGNISGIQFDLKEHIEQAEHELAMSCPELHQLNRLLRRRLDDLYDKNTEPRNTDPVVKSIIGMMHDMAFNTDDLHQVASHPLPALVIFYIGSLTGYHSPDSLALTRWGEAQEKAKKYIAALEEMERA